MKICDEPVYRQNIRRHIDFLADTVDGRDGSEPQVFWCEVRDARALITENDELRAQVACLSQIIKDI